MNAAAGVPANAAASRVPVDAAGTPVSVPAAGGVAGPHDATGAGAGHAPAPRRATPLAWLLIQPIRFYQRFITPYTPATCRYYPTCSSYAVRALRTHGAVKGTLLTAWRLLRCNPWSSGGIDHVPPRGAWRPARLEQRDLVGEVPAGAPSPLVTDRRPAERPAASGRSVEDPAKNAQHGKPCAPIAGSTAA
jgi:putative membrane protein insertion efficiency factor